MQHSSFLIGSKNATATIGQGKFILLTAFHHCCLCFVCSAFFGGVGNSFRSAFRLYCRYNKWEGERQHGTEKEPLCSGTPQPPRASLRGQRGGGPDHQRIHHEPADRILQFKEKRRYCNYERQYENDGLPDPRGALPADQGPPGAGNPTDRQEADPAGVRAEPDRGSAGRG